MNRRIFLKSSALALAGSALTPNVFVRMANAATTGGKKTLVAIFQRGAVDGLNVVVPYAEAAYYAARPNIAIPKGKLVDLDGFFGAHPAIEPLLPFYKDRSLAFVHAVGSPDATRSHFDAQDFMECGTPGVKSTSDGFLARALSSVHPESIYPERSEGSEPGAGTMPTTPERRTLIPRSARDKVELRGTMPTAPERPTPIPRSARDKVELLAVAIAPTMPRILSGHPGAVAMTDIARFGIRNAGDDVAGAFDAMYGDAFEASRILKATSPERLQPANGAEYPRSELGNALRQIAQLIKSGVGLEVAFADVGGWDTHAAQGGEQGQLANNLRPFAQAIAAFARDLGSRMSDVVLVTMSEFGRTVRENGNRGTDHGHATIMLTLGGSVKGGKVYGRWPGLSREQLFEGRDVAVTTDFRDVFAELLTKHLGVTSLTKVFPRYAPRTAGLV